MLLLRFENSLSFSVLSAPLLRDIEACVFASRSHYAPISRTELSSAESPPERFRLFTLKGDVFEKSVFEPSEPKHLDSSKAFFEGFESYDYIGWATRCCCADEGSPSCGR